MASIYDFTVRDIDAKERSLSEFRGKVLLIVNVASKCGFTWQYEGLEALHRAYADKGFKVLGFPSNQFKNQEPGNAEEIKNFCIDRAGKIRARFSPLAKPEKLQRRIEALL